MKLLNRPFLSMHKLAVVLVLCGLAALTGCTRQPPPAGHDDHDHAGHNHPAATPTGAADKQSGTTRPVTQENCDLHAVPRTLCFICDPSLRDPARLWCNEHTRYEDRCWECHPLAHDPERLYCDEHGLYEDECFYCHPDLIPAQKTQSGGSPETVLMCEEHGVPEIECGICRPEALTGTPAGGGLKVRLPSMDSARSSGITVGKPQLGPAAEGIDCYAELSFNQNRLAQIVAPVDGIIQEVPADLGQHVEPHQTVARLWSASIAEAVAKAVLSHQTLDRERRLREQRVTPEQTLQEAEATHRAACQQLRTLGFSEEQIDALSDDPGQQVLMDVRAPFAGEIVERNAVLGTLVNPGKSLFTIADRSTMWAMLNVPESALARVETGQKVELRFDSLPGQTFEGTLTWVGAEVDHRTRMARARAEVTNPKGQLRANMFARARIIIRTTDNALVVPTAAVQQLDGLSLVFVQLAPDLFEARRVQLGARSDAGIEILQGLTATEAIATAQVFPLKSQLLVSRLGAGCAHEK
jgi:cobalt-zinc-cadmium efflux system membrane fusion protein